MLHHITYHGRIIPCLVELLLYCSIILKHDSYFSSILRQIERRSLQSDFVCVVNIALVNCISIKFPPRNNDYSSMLSLKVEHILMVQSVLCFVPDGFSQIFFSHAFFLLAS